MNDPKRTVSLGGGVSAPYPKPSNDAATAVGKGNQRRDTKPEVRVRSLLHRRGLRFRKDLLIRAADTRVRPDIVFTRTKVAVFIDGCFWHQCPEHGTIPKSNRDYWAPKLAANRARDRRNDAALRQAGWRVLRVWEHEDPLDAAMAIERAINE